MEVDLSQFFQSFFEESFEGLDSMEEELLNIDVEAMEMETINTIFRAAHSIKGGASTFGFQGVSDFTHVMETLLDEVRDEQQSLDVDKVDLLLASVDCLRNMLSVEKIRSEEEGDARPESVTIENNDVARDLHLQLEKMLLANSGSEESPSEVASRGAEDAVSPKEEPGEVAASSSSEVQSEPAASEGGATDVQSSYKWRIKFVPNLDILKSGNDPVRIVRELCQGGDCRVTPDLSRVPKFEDLDPLNCYISWILELSAKVTRKDIDTAFEWVIDECDIEIEEIEQTSGASPSAANAMSQASTDDAPTSNVSKLPVAGSDSGVVSDGGASEEQNNEKVNTAQQESPKKTAAASKQSRSSAKKGGSEGGSIRVSTEKIDELVNLVGELVITQSMLSAVGTEFNESMLAKLQQGLSQLEHSTREIQESVIRIRMLPISATFNRFKRMVRDISRDLGKSVDLVINGESTELDKTVLERIADPLVHLVRNGLDHGLERPDVRVAAGKPETGTLELNAYHQSGNIIIEIIDDGKGLPTNIIREKAVSKGLVNAEDHLSEQDIHELIFHPGFSTAEQVTGLSGRGVGMDVVRRNILELGGHIEVFSTEGEGSRFVIRLPLTLAILDGQLIRLHDSTYIVPLVNIIESIPIKSAQVNRVVGGHDVFSLRDEYIPVVHMHSLFNVQEGKDLWKEGLMVIVESEGFTVGLVVDELLSQQQVVIKSMETNYNKVDGVAGATILGDGRVSLILDIGDIVKMAGLRSYFKTVERRRDGSSGKAA